MVIAHPITVTTEILTTTVITLGTIRITDPVIITTTDVDIIQGVAATTITTGVVRTSVALINAARISAVLGTVVIMATIRAV